MTGRGCDRCRLSILRRLAPGSPTTVILPVPILDDLIDRSAQSVGMPAHVTILYPFLRAGALDCENRRALASLILGTAAFPLTLERLGRFPPSIVYLAPDPGEPFTALTRALAERWPGHLPYGGAHEEVVPHLTVGYEAEVPAELIRKLPVQTRAEEAWMMGRAPGRWIRLARFPLGPAESRA